MSFAAAVSVAPPPGLAPGRYGVETGAEQARVQQIIGGEHEGIVPGCGVGRVGAAQIARRSAGCDGREIAPDLLLQVRCAIDNGTLGARFGHRFDRIAKANPAFAQAA
jgi:hypothetical protein